MEKRLDLNTELFIRGCIDVPNIISLRQELFEIFELFDSMKFENKDFELCSMNLNDAIKDVKIFFYAFLNLHKVTFYKNRNFWIFNVDSFNKVNPLKLPILDSDDCVWSSSISERLFLDGSGNGYIFFDGIYLPKNYCEITSSSYTHEIVHSQIDSLRGSIENYLHSEVISMFVELVHAYYLGGNEKILKYYDLKRNIEMKVLIEELSNYYKGEDFSFEEMIENCKYLVSNLISFNLFSKFYFGNTVLRDEMMVNVQKIFDGEFTVEDFITLYDAQYENSLDVKKLGKYFKR